jgi:hypothetical protein
MREVAVAQVMLNMLETSTDSTSFALFAAHISGRYRVRYAVHSYVPAQ